MKTKLYFLYIELLCEFLQNNIKILLTIVAKNF